MAGPPSKDAPADPAERAALDRHLGRFLVPLLAGVAGLYLGFAVLHSTLIAAPAPLRVTWPITALLLGALALWLRRHPVRPGTAHRWLALVGVLVLSNSVLLLWTTRAPVLYNALALSMLGFAVFALSLPWVVTYVTAALAAWGVLLAVRLPEDPANHARTIILLSAAVLALLAQTMRVRTFRLLERARAREAQAAREAGLVDSLRALDRFKTDFVNHAAHQLNTPLTPLRVHLHALRKGLAAAATPAHGAALDALERNVERMATVVDGVVRAAQVQAGELAVHLEDVDAADRVRQAVQRHAPRADRGGIQLAADAAGPAPARADPAALDRVLDGLLDNALRHTRAGGRVTVAVRATPHGARVEVRDTGSGFAPERAEQLFQPFSTLADAEARTGAGIGLGLYLARALVQAQGGSLTAASGGPGQGATFTLDLPPAATPGGPA